MKIVELYKEQLSEYKKFFTRGLVEHPQNFRISPEDELKSTFPTYSLPDSFTLGALNKGNAIMGVISFQREGENRIKIRHKGLLFRMYVAQEFSGSGVGKALILALLERARKLENLEQINLTVVTSNIRAKMLYASFGFETYGVEKRAHKSGSEYFDEELMALDFQKVENGS